MRLQGVALREAESQALISWEVDPPVEPQVPEDNLLQRMSISSKNVLLKRGEPAPYITLHTAAFSDLAKDRQLGPQWEVDEGHPQTILAGKMDTVLYDRAIFQRLGRGSEPEYGHYWLVDSSGASDPLADRVELELLALLREQVALPESRIITHIYQTFAGLLTPNRGLVMSCLRSYAEMDEERGLWQLRLEDREAAREEDKKQMIALLIRLGERLGFKVEEDDTLRWHEQGGEVRYHFIVQETANFGKALRSPHPTTKIVLPGGRSTIVLEKSKQDHRLDEWLRSGPKVIKFRHVRRLEAETTLSIENLDRRLAIDPPDQHDPQLPLL
jgi:hypothetical protein